MKRIRRKVKHKYDYIMQEARYRRKPKTTEIKRMP